ncbi:MAG: acetolactate synthase large subunit [Myxococcales bacterium]|nr:acetolactate synthase large subunit [Myxococcales bacterium]MDH5565315.1 acetolactate synthase large subunit [Myxococcales bacterium]
MNGAESLLRTAAAAGLEVCFANPGTTEMPLVVALDAAPQLRAVLGLFEGVCTGAADGYGRMAGRPALTLLHCGPGFANGIANLHNARRARTPVVNLIGDHATWHAAADAPLASDIESLARPVSGWLRRASSGSRLASDGAHAIRAACTPPGQVASLIVPHDIQWCDAAQAAEPLAPPEAPRCDGTAIAAAVTALRAEGRAALLLGGAALADVGLRAAGRIARATRCTLIHDTFVARLERGSGLPRVERLPYFPEQARELLGGFQRLILVGARDPVAFFGYRDQPSRLAPPTLAVLELASAESDGVAALEALAEDLGAREAWADEDPGKRPDRPSGALSVGSLGQALAALQGEGAIVVDEAATSGIAYHAHARHAPRHTVLGLTGGAIGQGLPCAVGAAIACPQRKVIALQADGGAMYTLQSLWTAAREGLDIVAVICANRAYRILQVELARAGVSAPGPKAAALTALDSPALDWVALARGMGLPGVRTETADAFAAALERALAEPGPVLIEAVL